jgi:hypothetical protein
VAVFWHCSTPRWDGPGRGKFSVDHAAGITVSWNTWMCVVATVARSGAALLMRAVLHRAPPALVEKERVA